MLTQKKVNILNKITEKEKWNYYKQKSIINFGS